MKTLNVNMKLSHGQHEFIRRYDDQLVIMSTSISYGKSFVSALWIITELLKGHKILAAAQTHGALRKVLFDHVFNICSKYHIPYKRNKEDRSIRIGKGICLGFSGESPDECLGVTNAHGFIIDEAARCPFQLYKNLCERCRGEGVTIPHHRLISSPLAGEPAAEWFLELKQKHPECVIHGSLYEALEAGFVDKEFVKSMEEVYPIGTPIYDQQILGLDIASDYLNAIVKDSDFSVSAQSLSPISTPYFYGMDFATSGRDLTVSYVINSTGIIEEHSQAVSDTATHTEMVQKAYDTYKQIDGYAFDGSGGFAQGCYDNFKHKSYMNVRQITFSEVPSKPIYKNIRAEMYMELAQAIKDGFYIDKVKYPKLIEELRNTRFFIDERGLIRIMPKDEIKKSIGRSPDHSDALALAVYAMNHMQNDNRSKASVYKYLHAMGY